MRKNSLLVELEVIMTEFKRKCPSCKKTIIYQSSRAVWLGDKVNAMCRPCANKRQSTMKLSYKEIPISWFNGKIKNAKERGIEFDITVEYVYNIYLKQNKECSLTGVPLIFNYKRDKCNVSIDRVNSSKGYVKRNIQLVLKDVNYMKYIYSQKRFIEICHLVAKKHPEKNKK